MRITTIIRNFLNGLAFGITETIPGVSGGTIAIILGFYDELIETVNHFARDFRKRIKFLLPLLIGIATGLILFSSIINYLLTNFSFPTMAFFIGLIVGIVPLIFVKVKDPNYWFKPKELALILLPCLTLVVIANLKPISVTDPADAINNIGVPFMLFIFMAGIIAAAALVIPGVSGSFMLLLMGIYHLAIYSVSSIGSLLADITNISLMLDIAKVLVPLAAGIIIGGLSMARIIEKLLKNHHKTIYAIILGLLLGSVYVLFRDPGTYQSGLSALPIVIGIATFSMGCVISYTLGKKQL